MVVGWASGRYGLFGLTADTIANPALNYAGVACVIVCLVIFTKVQTKTRADQRAESLEARTYGEPLIENGLLEAGGERVTPAPSDKGDGSLFAPGTKARRLAGIAMAVVSGLFYGSNFDPPQYVIDHHADDETRSQALNYVFSHFTGILCSSVTFFCVYCLGCRAMGKKPDIRWEIAGPAFISGLIWGLADICWFVANEALSFSVSFPLVTSGPGFIAAFWGIAVYGEISGRANFTWLGIAFVILVVACALIVASH